MKYPIIISFLCVLVAGCPSSDLARVDGRESSGSPDVRTPPDAANQADAGVVDGAPDTGDTTDSLATEPDVGSGTEPDLVENDLPADTEQADTGPAEDTPANRAPTALADDEVTGVEGAEVTFDGTASSDPDGTIVSYQWFFGDGAEGSGVTATHVYSVVGEFNARLLVEDDGGLTDAFDITVTIAEAVEAPVAVISVPSPVILGEEVTFDGTTSSDADGEVVRYDWAFRLIGSPDWTELAGGTVALTFAVPGAHEARLTVTDNDDLTGATTVPFDVLAPPQARLDVPASAEIDEVVSLSASLSFDPDGTIVAFDWAFGDDETGVGDELDHSWATEGVYQVTVTVTDDDGLEATATSPIAIGDVNVPPVADAGTDQSVEPGVALSFDGRDSTDVDGSIVGYHWDFGDDETAEWAAGTHTYPEAGTYTVSLTVEDDGGDTDTHTVTITVNTDPVAAFDVLPASPEPGESVSFDSVGSYDPDDQLLVGWTWDFGDGEAGAGAATTHSYAAAGTYTARLTVRDPLGGEGTVSQEIEVTTGGGSVDGLWNLRPNDSDDTLVAECLGWELTVGGAVCDLTQDGAALTLQCADAVFSGARTGDDFAMAMRLQVIPDAALLPVLDPNWDPFWLCGAGFVEESLTGTFESGSLFQASSDLAIRWEYEDPFFCPPCTYVPLPKTGRKL